MKNIFKYSILAIVFSVTLMGIIILAPTIKPAYAQSAQGTLQCVMTSENSISLEFTFSQGTNVSIFRGDSSQGLMLGSGSGSGTRTNSRLNRGDTYTYYLRNGSSSSATLLASATCSTLGADAPYWEGGAGDTAVSGSLSCAGSTDNSITLNYQFQNGTDVTIYRESNLIAQLGSGTISQKTGRNTNNSPTLDTVVCATQGTGTPGTATGTLSCGAATESYITLQYSFTNGTNVSIFKGDEKLTTLGSGKKTDQGRDLNLEPGTSYSYRLVNGETANSPTLDTVVCATQGTGTPGQPDEIGEARGGLTCGTATANSISVRYEFENGTDVSVYQGSNRIAQLGSGSKSGSGRNINLQPGRSYNYYLRNGISINSPLLATVTCSTLNEEGGETPVYKGLTCIDEQLSSIKLGYDFSYNGATELYRDDDLVRTFAAGENIGNITDNDLEATTPYVYTIYSALSKDVVIASKTCFTRVAADDIEQIPSDGKVQLPLCPFSGASAVWAKHKSCSWDKRIEIGTSTPGEVRCGFLNIFRTHTGWFGKYPTVSALWLPAAQASSIDLCTTTQEDFSILPACPEAFGPVGSVWAKPTLLSWNESSTCQIGTDCFKDLGANLGEASELLAKLGDEGAAIAATLAVKIHRLKQMLMVSVK